MLARNPNTGKDIRILKSDTSIWKNSKTLVWMKGSYGHLLNKWKRWDIIVAGIEMELLAWNPYIVVITENTEAVRKWLKSKKTRDIRFILTSSKVAEAIAAEGFSLASLGNVLCLEELDIMYPFIGPQWDGTLEDAIVCAAIIFRFNKLVGITDGHPRLNKILIDKIQLKLIEKSKAPEPLVLIQQYYNPKNSVRAKELYKCLKKNVECEYIDSILLFMESNDLPLPPDPKKKIKKFSMKSRISYANCIEAIQKQLGAGFLVAFANMDIYLDFTWRSIWSTDLHDVFVALLRWEEGESGEDPLQPAAHKIFGPRADSQDCWLIHSDSVMNKSWDLNALNIPFGKAGCDNAILIEFLRQKFKIVNPAINLRSIHVHKSEIRTYDKKELVDRPSYMYVEPSGIHELNPLQTWDGWADVLIEHSPLDRPLAATNPKMLAMFCSQLNRDPSFVWSVDGTNAYLPPLGQDRIIDVSGGIFVSGAGLVCKHSDILVGTTDIQKNMWSENPMSHVIPAISTKEMMALPFEESWLNEPALYILYYLSRVLEQNNKTPNASFWSKKTDKLLSAIQLFQWDPARGGLLAYDEDYQVFCGRAVGRTAHGVRIMPRDISALRACMAEPWVSEVIVDPKPIIVIVADNIHIKDILLETLHKKSEEAGYEVRIVSYDSLSYDWAGALSGASRVVLSTSKKTIQVPSWAWMWLAPKGCKILELQEEREPSTYLLHLSAAANLEWTLLLYPRSTPDGFRSIILKEFAKWFTVVEKKLLPVIYTPPKSMKFGFFGHKGDSFREMIDLWVEKGFVERKEDPSLTQCWLGGIGKTLLYDRPTWDWLGKASEQEQTYKLCLAGNPSPSEKVGAQPWIFWPRQPRLVETIAANMPRDWKDRADTLVFYGRIENSVQGSFRQEIDGWRNVCTKFSMQMGTKEPYLLNPTEYLEALANSKYGLCLRGFGPKCNREIELLAMGTVPVVVEGVDFENYIEPLIDGVHLLRVSSPEDAEAKIATITESQWQVMSNAAYNWWKRNASVEGSWARTKEWV